MNQNKLNLMYNNVLTKIRSKIFNLFEFVIIKIPFTRKIVCYYCSWIFFVRSLFLVERPIIFLLVTTLYPITMLGFSFTEMEAGFLVSKVFISLGLYLISVDSIASMISGYILSQKPDHYLRNFFFDEKKKKTAYFEAGFTALFFGKTSMTATGRAALGAGALGAGMMFFNGYRQRVHEKKESNSARTHNTQQDASARAHEAQQAANAQAHEIREAEKNRAYQNYIYARDQHDKKYFRKGPKPCWSEENYEVWLNEKKGYETKTKEI